MNANQDFPENLKRKKLRNEILKKRDKINLALLEQIGVNIKKLNISSI